MTRTRGWGALALLVLLSAATGCVSLPESGAVATSAPSSQETQEQPIDFDPDGPRPGDTRDEIVQNFLAAMQATPLTTFTARQFLTSETRHTWVPGRGTVIYNSYSEHQHGDGIQLDLTDTNQLDDRGEWLGDPTGGKTLSYQLRLTKERGQWRIANPPDRLIIPMSHYDTRFHEYDLYFFDSTGTVLVPEPVFLPYSAQTPTLLVAGLLRGPDPGLSGVERSYFPPHARLGDISVPVSRSGTADVPVSDNVLSLDKASLDQASAQLAWTLRQVPGIDRFQLTQGGTPLDLTGGRATGVDAATRFDPAYAGAAQGLFGLHDGRVVGVTGSKEYRVPGVFDSTEPPVRSLGVDLDGQHFAEVTADGTTVLASARTRPPVENPPGPDSTTIYQHGTDLLQPVWDVHGMLWLIDRTSRGARLTVVTKGDPLAHFAKGITGEDVRSFALSRDGSRLVADVHGSTGDRLMIARVVRDPSGSVTAIAPARRLPLGTPGPARIRALAFNTPVSLAVLTRPSQHTSQVSLVNVDGSQSPGADTGPELFLGRATTLAASSSPGAPLYIGTADGRLFQLSGNGRWVETSIPRGLRSPTFVG
ncbi:MAG: LpqB family beta-propeller domain-containing protein [Nocardioidaceae bacterium]